MLNEEVKQAIDKAVLCWLATVNAQNEPNVSPKEMFSSFDKNTIIIANIASPKSIENILQNPKVCLSFVDVFVQKGFKIKGIASILLPKQIGYHDKAQILKNMYSDQFEIKSIIEISVLAVESIVAPSYFKFPEKTIDSQIADAMKTYGVKPA